MNEHTKQPTNKKGENKKREGGQGVGVQQKNSAKTMRPASSILPYPIQTLQPNDNPFPTADIFYFEKMVGKKNSLAVQKVDRRYNRRAQNLEGKKSRKTKNQIEKKTTTTN